MSINLLHHNWKTTLVHLRRHFVPRCEPSALTYNGFLEEGPPLFSQDGERIWARYAVGHECIPISWEAEFTDTNVRVKLAGELAYTISYQNIKSVRLPKKSERPMLEECNGKSFYSQRAFIIGHDGNEFEVRGTITSKGYRDIYLWSTLLAALRDQFRHSTIVP